MEDSHTRLLAVVKKYTMPAEAAQLLKQNPPLILTAITASGKDTVASQIIKTSDYREVITHTTRSIRPGEKNGINYWFVSETKMLELIQKKAFIETKAVHGETIYGTSIKAYQTATSNAHKPLIIIDVQGVEEISRAIPGLKPFFILPPSYEEWTNRLYSRGVITEEDKVKRMASARREIQTVLDNPAYILVVNDKVQKTAEEILSGEHNKTLQRKNRQLAKKLLDQLNN